MNNICAEIYNVYILGGALLKRHTSAYEGRKRTYTQGYLNAKQNVNAAVYKVIPYVCMYVLYMYYIYCKSSCEYCAQTCSRDNRGRLDNVVHFIVAALSFGFNRIYTVAHD